MSDLHMIELWPQEAQLLHFLQGQGMNDTGDEDLGYGMHAWLKAAFGALAPKPFRILSKPGRPLRLLAYAPYDRDALCQRLAEFADPAVHAVCLPETIASRKMPDRWMAGRRLGFEVLCCPVVRKEGMEKDVFLSRADRLGPDAALSRSEIYCQWLERRMEEAVTFIDLRLQRFRLVKQCRQKSVARGERRKHVLVRPQVMFTGEFLIQNEAALSRLLVCGIGRHRAFGYGMLLLRPTS